MKKAVALGLWLYEMIFIIWLANADVNAIKTIGAYITVCVVACVPIWLVLMYTQQGKTIIARVRGLIFSIRTHQKCRNLCIGKSVTLKNSKCIKMGHDVTIDSCAGFFPYVGGNTYPSLKIGSRVHIGEYDRFACSDSVEIEDDVLLAAYVHITDHSHQFIDPDIPINKQGIYSKGPVRIGEGSWIGLRCSILSGVTIGKHCVIAAGSVVTHDVPDYSIAAGVPAKIIKKYNFELKRWVSV